jgi:hypothetical protein
MKPDSFINNLWLKSVGEKEDWSWLNKKRKPSFRSLIETEWDDEYWSNRISSFLKFINAFQTDEFCDRAKHILNIFKEYAINRMIMGALRYDLLSSGNHLKFDNTKNFKIRLDKAFSDKNLEYLVDSYNIAYLHSFVNMKESTKMANNAISYFVGEYDSDDWSFDSKDDGIHKV